MNEKNAQLVAGLRELCAFIEANDDFEFVTGDLPLAELHFRTWFMRGLDKEQQRERIGDLAKRLGHSQKVYSGDFFWLRHNFGELVQLEAVSMRDVVCERVVTGKQVIPAKPRRHVPAEPAHEIEIVEWKCAPFLPLNQN